MRLDRIQVILSRLAMLLYIFTTIAIVALLVFEELFYFVILICHLSGIDCSILFNFKFLPGAFKTNINGKYQFILPLLNLLFLGISGWVLYLIYDSMRCNLNANIQSFWNYFKDSLILFPLFGFMWIILWNTKLLEITCCIFSVILVIGVLGYILQYLQGEK